MSWKWQIIVAVFIIMKSIIIHSYRYKYVNHIRINSRRSLNRILFDINECTPAHTNSSTLIATLPSSDPRCIHIKKILKSEVGDILKVGVLNRGIQNYGRITNITASHCTLSLSSEEAPLLLLSPEKTKPAVELILAVPRPLRLERLLPVIAAQGVGRLVLVGAEKVERDYFGK